ncbi:VanZ family protein [Clostridium aminobutyricum]|uniref:VanZ family protein n=1 Tax=Clostridium aminobutyricum TaxID=33953 RepID=A0A939D739_CLOAM|nr:VanZ family protein [Clostridium aminobutyricum]MBN7772291.1 VanZ family protein [Clostridium aminobutyricum]
MKKEKLFRLVFWIYISVLFIVVVLKFDGSLYTMAAKVNTIRENRSHGYWNYNLEPFYSLKVQFRYITHRWALENILGNIIPFIPFGILLPTAYKKCRKWWKVFGITILTILGMEVTQLVTMFGIFDVDDIMLNTAAAMIGYAVFSCFQKGYKVPHS